MAKIKNALKALIPYIIALVVGLFLTWICTPYAKAHRANPTLIGGEVCLPILTILAVLLFKSFKEFRMMMQDELNDTDKNDN